MTPLYLKRGEERRLRTGHPWVYDNELDVGRARLRGLPPGEPVELRDHRGEPLASAYANPHSLIAARIVSREPGVRLDRALLAERIGAADALRRREFDAPYYRSVFGESDALPGLIVDRYGDVAVVQISTAGMERVRDDVVSVLRSELGFRTVVLRNDTPVRSLEGLESSVEVVGEAIGETVTVEEGGGVFEAAPLSGQLADLVNGLRIHPQVLLNVPVARKPPLDEVPVVVDAIRAAEARLVGAGRVLVRYSGTEAVLRVMIEGRDREVVQGLAEGIAARARRELA